MPVPEAYPVEKIPAPPPHLQLIIIFKQGRFNLWMASTPVLSGCRSVRLDGGGGPLPKRFRAVTLAEGFRVAIQHPTPRG